MSVLAEKLQGPRMTKGTWNDISGSLKGMYSLDTAEDTAVICLLFLFAEYVWLVQFREIKYTK